MSASSHDASTSSSAHAAHADHAHAFDGEPVKVLPPDEPRTPGWVPLVGLLLFVFGGVAVLLTGDDDAASGSAKPEKTSVEARPAQAAEPPARPPVAPPGAGQNPQPAVQRLSPEAAAAVQKRLEDARARQAAAAAQQGAQPAPGAGQPQRNILRPPQPAPAPGGGAQ